MELVLLYILFAITTALTAIIVSLRPAILRREAEGFAVFNKGTVYFAFFVVALIAAPLVFFSFTHPYLSLIFQKHVYDGLFKED